MMASRAARFDTFYLPVADLNAWMDVAVPKDAIDYAHGVSLDQSHASVRLVAQWVKEELVITNQRREAGAIVHMARRVGAVSPDGDLPENLTASLGGMAEEQMLRIIANAARFGLPCPSYSEMAEELGLRDRRRARYLFDILKRIGMIAVRHGERSRIVSIIGTTLETADAVEGEA